MDAFLIFLTVFVTLVCSLCTALLVPLRQRKLRVDPSLFLRIKVPFPASLLFVGIGKKSTREDVQNFGVILPMFVLHILGYLLTVLIWALVPTLYYKAGMDTDILFVIPLAVAVPYVIAVVLAEYCCVKKSRNKQSEQPQDEETHIEEETGENQG